MVAPDGRHDSARRTYLTETVAPILAIAFAALAVVVAVIAAVPVDWAGGGAGSPTTGGSATPTAPPSTSPSPAPTGTSSPSPTPPVAIVRIEVVQAEPGDRSKDSTSWTQTFVSLLTAVGALLAGIGALAALRRPSPAPAPPRGATGEPVPSPGDQGGASIGPPSDGS